MKLELDYLLLGPVLLDLICACFERIVELMLVKIRWGSLVIAKRDPVLSWEFLCYQTWITVFNGNRDP